MSSEKSPDTETEEEKNKMKVLKMKKWKRSKIDTSYTNSSLPPLSRRETLLPPARAVQNSYFQDRTNTSAINASGVVMQFSVAETVEQEEEK